MSVDLRAERSLDVKMSISTESIARGVWAQSRRRLALMSNGIVILTVFCRSAEIHSCVNVWYGAAREIRVSASVGRVKQSFIPYVTLEQIP